MCPACIASAALIATSAGSTGGLAALAARILHIRRTAKKLELNTNAKEKSS